MRENEKWRMMEDIQNKISRKYKIYSYVIMQMTS